MSLTPWWHEPLWDCCLLWHVLCITGVCARSWCSEVPPACCYFDYLALCRCPFRRCNISPTEWLRTQGFHGLVWASGPQKQRSSSCYLLHHIPLLSPWLGPSPSLLAFLPILSLQPFLILLLSYGLRCFTSTVLFILSLGQTCHQCLYDMGCFLLIVTWLCITREDARRLWNQSFTPYDLDGGLATLVFLSLCRPAAPCNPQTENLWSSLFLYPVTVGLKYFYI